MKHSNSVPHLKSNAAIHGRLALIKFDPHQDTWCDDGNRIDHETLVSRSVKEGLINSSRSIQIGIRTHAQDAFGIEIICREKTQATGVEDVVNRIRKQVGGFPVYMTSDTGCLNPAFAPGNQNSGVRWIDFA